MMNLSRTLLILATTSSLVVDANIIHKLLGKTVPVEYVETKLKTKWVSPKVLEMESYEEWYNKRLGGFGGVGGLEQRRVMQAPMYNNNRMALRGGAYPRNPNALPNNIRPGHPMQPRQIPAMMGHSESYQYTSPVVRRTTTYQVNQQAGYRQTQHSGLAIF
jgi:hypothetical protein